MSAPSSVDQRAAIVLGESSHALRVRTDRLMLVILGGQWLLGIILALVVSPYAWEGRYQSIHVHVVIAVVLGGLLNSVPALLIFLKPGSWITRQVITVAQMLWSALLIHLTGGRVETHFHIFGSLAFLAFYCDWTLLPTAIVIVSADHLIRGLLWPESVYGITNPEWWRFLEHAGWVMFESIVLALACLRGMADLRIQARQQAAHEDTNSRIEAIVAERTEELHSSREEYRALVETANAITWVMDPETKKFEYIAPQARAMFGYAMRLWRGEGFHEAHIHPDDRARVASAFAKGLADNSVFEVEYRILASDERYVEIRNAIVVAMRKGRPLFRGIMFDMSERRRLEHDLAQAQKLESIGRLAAGVAHEINTPIQFIGDSIHFLKDATTDVQILLAKYQKLRLAVADGSASAEDAQEIADAESETDLDYLIENMPRSIDRAIDGVSRVAAIVRSMKEFAHPGTDRALADINNALGTTITIARNEFRYVAEVVTELGDIPMVSCFLGSLNQVFLNLLVNAAQAIRDAVAGTQAKGLITVRTRKENDAFVLISISDTGTGISEGIKSKVFDQFFTTKPVGQGTGQGLALASQVVRNHGGTIWFESEMGKGTTFFIKLPLTEGSQLQAA